MMPHDPFARNPLAVGNRTAEPGEIHDPLGVQSPFTRTRGQDFLRLSVSPKRLRAFTALALAAFFVVLGRSAYLQIIHGHEYRAASESNRIRRIPIFPLRGIVRDRAGTPLVANVPRFSVTVVPSYLANDPARRHEIIATLAPLAGAPADELEKFLKDRTWRSGEAILIADNVLQDDAVRLRVTLDDPGVIVEARSVREYLHDAGASLAHLVGYMGRVSDAEYDKLAQDGYLRNDVIGRTGLERHYEEILRGRMGVRQIEVDSRGRATRVVSETEPQDGSDITLALDFKAQEVLERALSRELRVSGKKRGAAIALDPRDGSIRAMVSLPGFDANAFVGGVDAATYKKLIEDKNQPLFPRATSGEYPSGSVIKPIFAALGLDSGVITPKTTVRSVGGIQIADSFFPDWKPGGHGVVDVIGAIAHSVNTFFYYMGGGYGDFKGMGPEALAVGAAKFGLGAQTGIDLPSEGKGWLPTPDWKKQVKGEPWYIGDTYHMAIGQGDLLVTPIQMAAATGAIANGGTLYRPHLQSCNPESREVPLRGTTRRVGSRAEPCEARASFVAKDHVVSPESLDIVRRGMRATVTVGTAQSLLDAPVAIAGKTGTAEWGHGKSPHAWIVGFAPYENPEIVIVVLVEQGGEGSTIAVPVAREFLNWYFSKSRTP